jgi:uracil-DNA glycosylase
MSGPEPAGGSIPPGSAAGPAAPASAGPLIPPDVAAGPVPPGSGWPDDPATPSTPVARNAAQVSDLAAGAGTLAELVARQSVCRACPRLVEWREEVAATKRRSLRAERYWGRPVPGWGSEQPRVLILGLAPAAHGGNRTGRVFTGDRSGDVLFASLYRCGLAATPQSTAAGDGQRLLGARMVAAVRCAPPLNKPTVTERDTCAPWLSAEVADVAPWVRVIVCLGGWAWQAMWPVLRSAGVDVPRPRPRFGHGTEVALTFPDIGAAGPAGAAGVADVAAAGVADAADVAGEAGAAGATGKPVLVIGCYHPSQQNTFTGRVTPAMLDEIFMRASRVASPEGVRGDAR